MATKTSFLLTISFISIFFHASNAMHFNYPAVFNFGDSNSDTGGAAAGLGALVRPPNGQRFFRKPSGRFCDGRLIIDFLMDAMDLPFLNPYLDSIGAPSFKTGCNFAVAASAIYPPITPPSPPSPFTFKIQVDQFIRLKARVLELQDIPPRIHNLIPEADYFSKGLYMFDMAQNDLTDAFLTKTLDQVLEFIPTIIAEFEDGIKELYDEGARNFWIHNQGPLGCIPQHIALFGTDPFSLDELGCVSASNLAAIVFNQHLYASCKKFQRNYPDANVRHVDIYSIKLDLIANYYKYGFKENTMACCGYGGPPLNFDPMLTCGQTKVINGSLIAAEGCADSTEYVNWDGFHYTEAANRHVVSQILTRKYSDPPFENLPMNLTEMKSTLSRSFD